MDVLIFSISLIHLKSGESHFKQIKKMKHDGLKMIQGVEIKAIGISNF